MILVGCEFSGVVRDAFLKRGYKAVSCDLRDSETPGPHIKGDLRELIQQGGWEAIIAFPPCTYLCSAGARWWRGRQSEQALAVEFVRGIEGAEFICIENPIGILSKVWRKPEQVIHPWQFGHEEEKKTCLWLKGLPLLKPTDVKKVRIQKTLGKNQLDRCRTFKGIAEAMADQWSPLFKESSIDLS